MCTLVFSVSVSAMHMWLYSRFCCVLQLKTFKSNVQKCTIPMCASVLYTQYA